MTKWVETKSIKYGPTLSGSDYAEMDRVQRYQKHLKSANRKLSFYLSLAGMFIIIFGISSILWANSRDGYVFVLSICSVLGVALLGISMWYFKRSCRSRINELNTN